MSPCPTYGSLAPKTDRQRKQSWVMLVGGDERLRSRLLYLQNGNHKSYPKELNQMLVFRKLPYSKIDFIFFS